MKSILIQKKYALRAMIFLAACAFVCVGGCLENGPLSGNENVSENGNVPGSEHIRETENTNGDATSAPDEAPGQTASPGRQKTVIVAGERDGQEVYYPLGFSRSFYPDAEERNHTIAVYQGDTIRFWNGDTKMNSKMLFHSVEGSFDDYVIQPRYSCYMTFPDIGKYQISLLNGEHYMETGERIPYPAGESVLTIYVVEKEPEATA